MESVKQQAYLGGCSSRKTVPFTSYDMGWVVLCIGMAIGSGVIFMPIQMGVKGVWVSLISLLIAYPAVHFMQEIYIRSLSKSIACEDYNNVISQYIGRNWGIVLSALYFLIMLNGMLSYSSAIVKDSASYLQTFHVTSGSVANSPWYIFGFIAVMVAIASRGERFLFKVSGPMIVVKISIVMFLGLSMIPYWNINNLGLNVFPGFSTLLVDVLLTLPFAMFSIFYGQILNPMNVAFRKIEKDPEVATYRALRVHRVALVILLIGVGFYALSFMLSINHQQATEAVSAKISALALAAQVMPGDFVRVLSTVLNIVAIFTAFFGIYLGFQDALKGILSNVMGRFAHKAQGFQRIQGCVVAGTSITLMGAWVAFGVSAMLLIQITVPIYGLVACIIPAYLVLKVPALQEFKGFKNTYTMVFGIALLIVPLMIFVEN
jgi:serine transporter